MDIIINYKIYNYLVINRNIYINNVDITLVDDYYIDNELQFSDKKNVLINDIIFNNILDKLNNINTSKILGCSSNVCMININNNIKYYYINDISNILNEIIDLF